MPCPGCFIPGKERLGTHCTEGWMGPASVDSTGVRTLDRPTRSESLHRLSYPGCLQKPEDEYDSNLMKCYAMQIVTYSQLCSFETSVNIYQPTRRNNTDDLHIQQHRCDSLKLRKLRSQTPDRIPSHSDQTHRSRPVSRELHKGINMS